MVECKGAAFACQVTSDMQGWMVSYCIDVQSFNNAHTFSPDWNCVGDFQALFKQE